MEWLWVLLLFAIIFGPIVLMLVRSSRGEKLDQGPDSVMESYRSHFDDWPKRGRG